MNEWRCCVVTSVVSLNECARNECIKQQAERHFLPTTSLYTPLPTSFPFAVLHFTAILVLWGTAATLVTRQGVDGGRHYIHVCKAFQRCLFQPSRCGDPAVALKHMLAIGSMCFGSRMYIWAGGEMREGMG